MALHGSINETHEIDVITSGIIVSGGDWVERLERATKS